jgi:hypothetical protein
MERLTARTSTIFIATGQETRVYRSIEEVPPALRRKLSEYTRGMNAATILIADKRGREELVRALQGRSSDVQCRLTDTLRHHQQSAVKEQQPRPVPSHDAVSSLRSVQTWLELLLPFAVGISLWVLAGYRYS